MTSIDGDALGVGDGQLGVVCGDCHRGRAAQQFADGGLPTGVPVAGSHSRTAPSPPPEGEQGPPVGVGAEGHGVHRAGAEDGKVRLWDLASQRQIGRPLPGAENGTGSNLNVSAFDPSGNHLADVYDNGVAFVWNMDPDHWKQQGSAVVGRSLTRQEWTELLPDRRYQPACR